MCVGRGEAGGYKKTERFIVAKKATINYLLHYFSKLYTLNKIMHVQPFTHVVPIKQLRFQQ